MRFKEGLTFDDVLLIPKKSNIKSRKQVDVSTSISRRIKLHIPIISANMDTVTESNMAIAMAKIGGLGIIHRFMTIEEQIREVLKVKRSEGIVIEDPYTVEENSKINDVLNLMEIHKISGVLVVDKNKKLLGIVTKRDIKFEKDYNKKVGEIMTKRKDLVVYELNKKEVDIEKAKDIMKKNKIEKLPIVDEQNILKGLLTAKDIMNMEKFPWVSKDKKGKLMVGAAVGVKGDFIKRANELYNAGCDLIVVDIAHGHSDYAITTIKKIKKEIGVEVMAGNVATKEGVEDLINAGADSIKVGIGSGSICITRIVTGCGVPQLTAIMECSETAKKYGISIIADGGIRNSGDIVKALAAGASAVMIGNLLAGTEEAPGVVIMRNGKKYKFYRGMASGASNISRKFREGEKTENLLNYVGEGVESIIEYKGTVKEVINQLVGGLKSGLSYCGAKNLNELRKNAEFIKITPASLRESYPHDIERI